MKIDNKKLINFDLFKKSFNLESRSKIVYNVNTFLCLTKKEKGSKTVGEELCSVGCKRMKNSIDDKHDFLFIYKLFM